MSNTDRGRALAWTADIAAAVANLANPATAPEDLPVVAAGILRRVDDLAALLGVDLNQPAT